jgi:antitoxin (DNA-binding transcriptional repressor) of toxin-antitoxin stability system
MGILTANTEVDISCEISYDIGVRISRRSAMDTIISVQDVRTRLGAISRRAEKGEAFTVIRNSKPAFRICPIQTPSGSQESSSRPRMSLADIADRFECKPVASDELSPEDVDRIIHEVHAV